MSQFETLADAPPIFQECLALVADAAFTADDAEGLRQRLEFVKGLLCLANVLTALDDDLQSWDEVRATLAAPAGGGPTGPTGLELANACLRPAVEVQVQSLRLCGLGGFGSDRLDAMLLHALKSTGTRTSS